MQKPKALGVTETILRNSVELKGPVDLDVLIEKIGSSRYVLLGEASHGTHEYYTWRTQISKWLIEEQGFSFVSAEGDWPDFMDHKLIIDRRLFQGSPMMNFMTLCRNIFPSSPHPQKRDCDLLKCIAVILAAYPGMFFDRIFTPSLVNGDTDLFI